MYMYMLLLTLCVRALVRGCVREIMEDVMCACVSECDCVRACVCVGRRAPLPALT